MAGYQWKQLFLPEGTRLRACFGGHSYFAQVEGDAIKYGEHAMSPSRFANLHSALARGALLRSARRESGSGGPRSAAQPAAWLAASAPVTCASPPCAKASQAYRVRRLP